jgi:hypothetical protein
MVYFLQQMKKRVFSNRVDFYCKSLPIEGRDMVFSEALVRRGKEKLCKPFIFLQTVDKGV